VEGCAAQRAPVDAGCGHTIVAAARALASPKPANDIKASERFPARQILLAIRSDLLGLIYAGMPGVGRYGPVYGHRVVEPGGAGGPAAGVAVRRCRLAREALAGPGSSQ
jgi:hypothetical protein